MANVEYIKKKILELDAGSFQNLCNVYLNKKGYKGIVCLGGQAGTRKTTCGTPDAYFKNNSGKYIFAEYTTQQVDIFKKIDKDIDKCLDVSYTKIPYDKIDEIIYCHTSSNLQVFQVDELVTKCKKVGIKLSLYGIDQIGEDIYLYYPNIANDFFNISITSGQIQDIDDFIKDYNRNILAAPLDTAFLFRKQELTDIDDKFKENNIVVLTGFAGIGKTRLALEFSKHYAENHQMKLLCIHSKDVPIFEELQYYIDSPGNYFIFVDDANYLTGLRYIAEYVNREFDGYNIKILITVREYAFEKVKNDISKISKFESITIKKFNDDQIQKLLEETFNIKNKQYIDQIIKISEGNARIALLAGKFALETNDFSTIQDASHLYDSYYGDFLKNDKLFSDDKMYITAGVISFLEGIRFEYMYALLPLLKEKGISRDLFIENLKKLNDKEIINIYGDKAAKVSDQCLSNYLIKVVFYDKKLLKLSEMIKACFPVFRQRTIAAIQVLLDIFKIQELHEFVKDEIKTLWEQLQQDADSTFFYDFFKTFYIFNPTKTLLILDEKINLFEENETRSNELDSDEIIEMLVGLTYSKNYTAALELFLKFLVKCPNLYSKFRGAVYNYFCINENSLLQNYEVQITFLNKIKEYSNDWSNRIIIQLFFDVAKKFLNLTFSYNQIGHRNNTIYHNSIHINFCEGVKKYRKIIWSYIIELSEKEEYKETIYDILYSYEGVKHVANIAVVNFDFDYIKIIMYKIFPNTNIKNCVLAKKLKNSIRFEQNDIELEEKVESVLSGYFNTDNYRIYKLLEEPKIEELSTFPTKQWSEIECFVKQNTIKEFKLMIDLCDELKDKNNQLKWTEKNGLAAFFEIISSDFYIFNSMIRYYIQKNTPGSLDSYPLVDKLFNYLDNIKVLELIELYDFKEKSIWKFNYYCELPTKYITGQTLQNFYDFLETLDNKFFISWNQFASLDKYNDVDSKVIVSVFNILLPKIYSGDIAQNVLIFLLDSHYYDPNLLIQRFKDNYDLLEKLFFLYLQIDNYSYINSIFLKELYYVYPNIIDSLISFILEDFDNGKFVDKNYICLFEFENYIEILNKIILKLIKECEYPQFTITYFLEYILKEENFDTKDKSDISDKQSKWIIQCIKKFNTNRVLMHVLFETIINLELKNKFYYIELFLKENDSLEDFKNLTIKPTSLSWSGSAVPLYSEQKNFLLSLLPLFTGLKWIKHKEYVEQNISLLSEQIEKEQINDILMN